MTLIFFKYLQICAFDRKFLAKNKPRQKSVSKRMSCAIYAYHMNGPLKFNLGGNGITLRKVLCI